METLMNDCRNYISFLFYEKNKECIITIYNNKEVLKKKIVSEEEGNEILLNYCDYYHGKLITSFDTIGLEIIGELQGFIRYMEVPGVIKNNNLIPTFLYKLLVTLQKQSEKINIEYKHIKRDNCYEISMSGGNDKHFFLDFDVFDYNFFSYIIDQYLMEHEHTSIKASENKDYVIIDNIQIPYEYLSFIQKCYLNIQLCKLEDMQKFYNYCCYLRYIKLSEKDKTSFSNFLNSSNGKCITDFVEESKDRDFVWSEEFEEMVLELIKPKWVQ